MAAPVKFFFHTAQKVLAALPTEAVNYNMLLGRICSRHQLSQTTRTPTLRDFGVFGSFVR